MKMIIKLIVKLILLCFFSLSSVFANANTDENLSMLKKMMPKVCHFSGEFTQSKQIKSLPVPLFSNGEFVYSCDYGLIWKTQKPILESLVFTNKKLHFLVSEKFSVENLEGVQHDFLANLLLGLMAGNTDFIANEFEISSVNGKQNFFTLAPKNKMVKQAIQSVTLRKPSNTNTLEITITDKNQQMTKIVSSEKQQFTSNKDFSKSCVFLSIRGCKVLLDPARINTSGKN